MGRHTGPCRACGVEMLWAETPDGNRQPFDREPNPEGNRVLLGRGPTRAPLAVPREWVDENLIDGLIAYCLYMPHHATCPDRDQFRRKGKP